MAWDGLGWLGVHGLRYAGWFLRCWAWGICVDSVEERVLVC